MVRRRGFEPQLHADNLKCVSRAARFPVGFVRLVGPEPAPSKCVLVNTSDWVVTDDGDRWSVKLDVRDLAGHLDSTFRGWSSTLPTTVRLVITR